MRASWVAVHVALLAVALRVWHMLLLKEHLDRPGVVAVWMGGAFLLFWVAREMALGVDPAQRGVLQRRYAAIRGPELSLVVLLFVLLFLFHWGFARAASDGREYFVQVRSLMIDGDLDLANENATFGVRGTARNYPFGTPLLWAPFFALAHGWLGLVNLLGGEYPRNGFFNPYQRAVGIGSLVYGGIALALIYRLLCRYFSRALAAATTIAVTLGSFIVWYLVVDNSMSHAASMFAVTLFVYAWHETRGERTPRRWALLGALAGLMSLVRWQNVLFVVFPAAEELAWLLGARRRSARAELSTAGPTVRSPGDNAPRPPVDDATSSPTEDVVPSPGKGTVSVASTADRSGFAPTVARYIAFVVGFIVAFSPQLFAWRALRGAWFDLPSGAHGAAFASPALGGVLFSPDRGLFSWTPLLLLATLGLLAFARRQPSLALLLAAALALQVYINATVEWSGHGFGARRFAGCAVVFAVGLAAFLQWMKQRPLVAPVALVGGLLVVNLLFMQGMRAGDVPPAGTVRFRDMIGATTSRIGNPFALPMSALTALRFDTDLGFYERVGSQTFNNLAIDVGGANDDRFLVHGWSGAEAGAGLTFRWSDGPESSLVVPLKEAVDYALELRAAPFEGQGQESGQDVQVVEVWVNDALAERVAVSPGMNTHRVTIDGSLLRPEFNEIRFRYAWTASPRDLGLSRDDRRLAVQFDRIVLTRLE